ncbi:MAG: hypothetical protein LBN21_08440 [Treponema sp.]|jgi:uroporphyrinogen decarboxylase|nr:hypothetical protein [Treponema sp.]
MTSKERIITALNHKEADRVPLDIGGTNCTAMHEIIETGLKKKLGLKDHGTVVKARYLGAAVPDESILEYFGADTVSIYPNETRPWIDNGDGTFIDMWGLHQQKNPDGYYYNVCRRPLEDAESIEDIEAYQFPEPTPYMLEGLRERALKNSDKYLILEGFREPLFGMASWLRGTENFYIDLASRDGMIVALLDKLLAGHTRILDYLMNEVGDLIDMVKFAEDLGSQISMLISPAMYREIIKPYQARLYGHVHEKYNKKVMLHSCGAIRPIINDFIEIGVDALNPVQISAKDMIPEELKAEFGDRIVFWGGGVDTQDVLVHAAPAEVKQQVKQNINAFKKSGGYVFAQVHNIVPGVPLENIIAMYEAFHENAAY